MNDKKNGTQSIDRSLEILSILAVNGKMTASALAKQIGIHQTSASRMLQSMQKARIVYKPDFHSFALDIGVLLLAGSALHGFPTVGRAVGICSTISRTHGLDAAAGALFNGKILYFARSGMNMDFRIVDDSNYPVHLSSIGLAVTYGEGKREALKTIGHSIRESGETRYSAREIYDIVDRSFSENGFLYLKDFAGNKINCSITFQYERGTAALAVFSKEKYFTPEEIKSLLAENLQLMTNNNK